MHIKPIQAKIIGGIVLIAGIIVVVASINSLRISADTITNNIGTSCPVDRTVTKSELIKNYGLLNFAKIKEMTGTEVKSACISSINPPEAAIGQEITITGTNFSTSRNNFILSSLNTNDKRFRFVKGAVASPDGTTLTLKIPKNIYGECPSFLRHTCQKDIQPGQYQLQIDPDGPYANKSNLYPITITSEATSATNISLLPTTGLVGVSVTVTASTDNAFTPTGNSINFNGSNKTIINLDSSDGKTLTFNIPTSTSSLDGLDALEYSDFPIEPGTYPISVTNGNGVTTSSQNFVITDSAPTPDATTNNSSLAPTSTSTPTNTKHIDSTDNSGQNTN